MVIAEEEKKTRREWIDIVNKHESVKVSNVHKNTPVQLAHKNTILHAAYERHEREMLKLDCTYHGICRILECKNKDQCKDRNCGF